MGAACLHELHRPSDKFMEGKKIQHKQLSTNTVLQLKPLSHKSPIHCQGIAPTPAPGRVGVGWAEAPSSTGPQVLGFWSLN